jgi:hypothetical protein
VEITDQGRARWTADNGAGLALSGFSIRSIHFFAGVFHRFVFDPLQMGAIL